MCSGDTAIFSCSRDADALEWSYDSLLVVILNDQSNTSRTMLVKGIEFEVILLSINSSQTTSTISFTATLTTNGKLLNCAGGSYASSEAIHVITDGKHTKLLQFG